MTKIIFKYDSRDKIFSQRFGQTPVQFPDEINFDTALPDDKQPVGNVQCVAFTTVDMAEDQTNIEFDRSSVDDLWKRVPSSQFGSDPRQVLSEAVKNGLLPKGATERLKNWKSYWRADLGDRDAFDNIRSSMMVAKCPVGVATYWYTEWLDATVLPLGKGQLFGHMYDVDGWKQINGEPHLSVKAWTGQKMWMSRAVLNAAMKPYGMQSWVLSTSEIDSRRIKSLTETVKDLIINLIIKLRAMLQEQQAKEIPVTPQPVPPPVPAQPTLREKIYLEARKWLAKDASPNNLAPEEVACAESVCFIIRKILPDFPMVTGTFSLLEVLRKDKRFKATVEMKPGNIILSPTGTGTTGLIKNGHVGIFGDSWIMSNDSKAKMWLENYTLDGWVQRFRKQGGYPIYYFEAI